MCAVAKAIPETRPPLSPFASSRANDFGGAECVEAVEEDNMNLDFGGLAVRVSCGDAFTQRLAVELVSAPSPRS
jgi:hypothetical protein